MDKQITPEQIHELVEFRFSPISQEWRVHKVQGNPAMDVIGDCYRVSGTLYGTIDGRGWVFKETPKQKLERLIKEEASKEELQAALDQMEDTNG